jgi:hypothetical protein
LAYERKLARPRREQRNIVIMMLSMCLFILVAVVGTGEADEIIWALPFVVLMFGIFRLAEANRWVRFQRQLQTWKDEQDQFEAQFPIIADRMARRGVLLGLVGPIYKSELAVSDGSAEDDEWQRDAPQPEDPEAAPDDGDAETGD